MCNRVGSKAERCRSITITIPEDLIWAVVVRLPAKSLMRFKCVSRQWHSMIRNPQFASEHGAIVGAGKRLLMNDNCQGPYSVKQLLLSVNIDDDCPRFMQHDIIVREPGYACITPVVNGLTGWYNDVVNEFKLCNVATRQLLKLPPAPDHPRASVTKIHNYTLGFDPANQLYKVLNQCRCFDKVVPRVFTLGLNNSDTNWREIAPGPLGDYLVYGNYVCINGAMYWMRYRHQSLIVFHLSNETFETILTPNFNTKSFELAEICGRPAIVVIELVANTEMMDIWTLNNHARGAELEAWTRQRLAFQRRSGLQYVGTLPTGEMMIVYFNSNKFPFNILVYDHLKNDFYSIKVEGDESQESGSHRHRSWIRYYKENIISLEHLMGNWEQDPEDEC